MWVIIILWFGFCAYMYIHFASPAAVARRQAAQTANLQGQITGLLGQIDCLKSIDKQQRDWARPLCAGTKANPVSETLIESCVQDKMNTPEGKKFHC